MNSADFCGLENSVLSLSCLDGGNAEFGLVQTRVTILQGSGGKNQESGELLKRVDSSGILAVPQLLLDSDSD